MLEVSGTKLYDIQEIAKMLNIHPQTVRRWIHSGKLPARKLGKTYYISEQELNDFTQISTEEKK